MQKAQKSKNATKVHIINSNITHPAPDDYPAETQLSKKSHRSWLKKLTNRGPKGPLYPSASIQLCY